MMAAMPHSAGPAAPGSGAMREISTTAANPFATSTTATRMPAGNAQDSGGVCRPGIAAALRADVGALCEQTDQEGSGNRPQEVGEDEHEDDGHRSDWRPTPYSRIVTTQTAPGPE